MAVLGATSLTGCDSIPQFMPGTADVGASATKTIFRMATSPVSWTKDTAAFDGMLRVVNGASLSPGGSLNFPVVFAASVPVSVTLDQNIIGLTVNAGPANVPTTNTGQGGGTATETSTISTTQMNAHNHPYIAGGSGSIGPGTLAAAAQAGTPASFGNTGSGGAHNHGIDGHLHSINGFWSSHSHTISGQHNHTVSSTQDFNINYVDMIISIKD